MTVVVVVLTLLDHSELAGSAVHSNLHVLARLVAGILDGLNDAVQGILDAVECGSETTLVTHSSAQAALLEQLGQCVEYLGTHANSLALVLGTNGTDHELLEGDGGIAVCTAIDDVHHGHGQHMGIGTTDVAVQGHTEVVGSSVSHGERNAQDGVSAEFALSGGAVEFDHRHVDGALVKGIHTLNLGSDYLVDVLNGLEDALAAVTLLVAVTQFKSLILTRRSATGHRCAAHITALEGYFNFNSRIATRIQNLSGMNLFNIHNVLNFWLVIKC